MPHNIWTQHNETHQTLLERGHQRGRGKMTVMEGVNLFKAYCTHVWNYHNEILLHDKSKIKFKIKKIPLTFPFSSLSSTWRCISCHNPEHWAVCSTYESHSCFSSLPS
jgi:hypothetical protein